MSNDYRDPAFKQWLDKLQQESWQLELIISGFAIYGLFVAYEPLLESARAAQNDRLLYRFIASAIGLIACSILLFNLLLHVVLRGLWIGALGLRYVSGDIDYDKLNYSGKFTRFLKKRIGSFDKYIATLENYCSILFAVSFLLIFYFLGIVMTMLALALVAILILDDAEGIMQGVGIGIVLVILLGMLLTLIDFITLGLLKRNKWVSKVYFPIYWVFSFLTLSFLYRPLVYNFLDNRFGKRLMIALIPFYAVLVVIASLEYRTSNYFTLDDTSTTYYSSPRNYDDELEDSDNFVRVASIQSRVITEPYVELFVLLNENVENYLFNMQNSLRPEKDERGLSSSINVTGGDRIQDLPFRKLDSVRREYIKTVDETYSVVIDSVKYTPGFVLTSNNKDQLGFESFINIKTLAEGKHILRLQRIRLQKGDTVQSTRVTIPFWYFKNP